MAKAKADTVKNDKATAGKTEEKALLARELARAIWLQEFKNTNPGADAETRKADWNENKLIYIKLSRAALRMLERKGISLQKTA